MSATLMYVGIGAALATVVGIFAIAVLFLQTARRYVDLTEKRLELLREGEAFLLKVVQRQGRALEESREREAQRQVWVPEMVGYPLGRQAGEEPPAGRRPEDSDRRVRETPSADDPPAEVREQRREKAPQADETISRPKDNAPLLGVQVPHPDDDVPGRGWNKSRPGSSRSATTGTSSTTRATYGSPRGCTAAAMRPGRVRAPSRGGSGRTSSAGRTMP